MTTTDIFKAGQGKMIALLLAYGKTYEEIADLFKMPVDKVEALKTAYFNQQLVDIEKIEPGFYTDKGKLVKAWKKKGHEAYKCVRELLSDMGSIDATICVIPDGVTEIGDFAFFDCERLTHISIPDSVTKIGKYAFSDCSRLTEINIPSGVTEIDRSTFEACYKLRHISIPDSVIKIGGHAFCCCKDLTEIDIPEGVTEIGDSAFSYCESLKRISSPNSVTKIGKAIFEGCESLPEIVVHDNRVGKMLTTQNII